MENPHFLLVRYREKKEKSRVNDMKACGLDSKKRAIYPTTGIQQRFHSSNSTRIKFKKILRGLSRSLPVTSF